MNIRGRIKGALRAKSYEERVERYLAGSTSHADLESRMREIDQGYLSRTSLRF